MKVRLGFVSNSSSSSYTCDFCGETESGYDMGLSDMEMVECWRGHYCCEHHLSVSVSEPQVIEAFLEKHPTYKDYDEDDILGELRYEFPSQFCPLCNLETISVGDILTYYRLRFGMNNHEIIEDIKATFGTYENFLKAARDAG